MRALKRLFAALFLLLYSGCIPTSLHPLYTEEDLIFDQQLVGSWSEDDLEEVWTFEPLEDSAYKLTIVDDGESAPLIAHLVRLEGHLFLDLYPDELEFGNDWYQFHLVPMHTFYSVKLNGDVLELALMDNEWLREKIDSGELGLRHEIRREPHNDRIFLTAPTAELQSFILAHIAEIFDYDDAGIMHRRDSAIPLIRAVRRGRIDSLSSLLTAERDLEERDGLGQTPLLWAARNGQAETARLLLDAGADRDARDAQELTPLLWAARNGHTEIVELLGSPLPGGTDANSLEK